MSSGDEISLAPHGVASERLEVPTSLGAAHVLVVGDRSLPAIVTFHEAGLTPEQTFGVFANAPRTSETLRLFAWYHVYAPGVQPGAPEWTGAYPTLEQIAAQLGEIVQHLKLGPAFICGVGAGGNVAAASFAERSDIWVSSLENMVWRSAELQHAGGRLLRRFFSSHSLQSVPGLVEHVRGQLSHMSANSLKFELAYENRDDITPRLANISASVLYFVGLDSPHADAQLEAWIEFNSETATGLRSSGAAKTSIVKVEQAGDLIVVEAPSALLQPLALFLVSLNVHSQELMRIDYVYDVNAVPTRQDSLANLLQRIHGSGSSVNMH